MTFVIWLEQKKSLLLSSFKQEIVIVFVKRAIFHFQFKVSILSSPIYLALADAKSTIIIFSHILYNTSKKGHRNLILHFIWRKYYIFYG